MFDLEKYMATFLAESNENLAKLETAIVAIETGNAFKRDLELAYRASHSVKGAARIFGFDRLGNLAEELEIVMHHLWEGRLAITERLISEVRRAKDFLVQLLDSERTKSQLKSGIEVASIEALLALSATAGQNG